MALDLTTDTLRYYERDNLLLRPVPRASSGHRRYQQSDLRWIELLSRLRATGMPIREMRRYADLVRSGNGNESERLDLLHAHRSRVLARLAELTDHLSAIDHKIGICAERVAPGATVRSG